MTIEDPFGREPSNLGVLERVLQRKCDGHRDLGPPASIDEANIEFRGVMVLLAASCRSANSRRTSATFSIVRLSEG
jgi:hypothetical protein